MNSPEPLCVSVVFYASVSKQNLFIGTSGWSYDDWRGSEFYPDNLAKTDELPFLAEHFSTVELNASFYHLPKEQTFKNWCEEVPEEFMFSVKASRYLTHIKKLKNPKEIWGNFYERAKLLEEKLGAVLVQLQPSWKKNAQRLKKFLKVAKKDHEKLALEFRHPSWFCDEIYDILKKYNIALVYADCGQKWPQVWRETSDDFVYLRMHGPDGSYATKYDKEHLKKIAKKIKKTLADNKEVYIYFNNDYEAFAIENTKMLITLMSH